MNYEKFCSILNKHIFEGEKIDLLRRLANNPERFISLFRPTKPGAKILQHLLQSHEIRMGDAFEEIIEEFLKDFGFEILNKILVKENNKTLSLDHYFTDGKIYYFIEQKIRDDHDSSKKEGQMRNFESKLEILYKRHNSDLIGIMYFIDPDLLKNKRYYIEELNKLQNFYGIDLKLFYGKELFDYFGKSEAWENILMWLKKWKDNLPELPNINFDNEPEKTFNEIKDLQLGYWRKILENDKLWEAAILQNIFKEGKTLNLMLQFFQSQNKKPYKYLAELLKNRIAQYY
jgi:hypothetical protein